MCVSRLFAASTSHRGNHYCICDNYNTDFCVYILKCPCTLIYVGKTIGPFKKYIFPFFSFDLGPSPGFSPPTSIFHQHSVFFFLYFHLFIFFFIGIYIFNFGYFILFFFTLVFEFFCVFVFCFAFHCLFFLSCIFFSFLFIFIIFCTFSFFISFFPLFFYFPFFP